MVQGSVSIFNIGKDKQNNINILIEYIVWNIFLEHILELIVIIVGLTVFIIFSFILVHGPMNL